MCSKVVVAHVVVVVVHLIHLIRDVYSVGKYCQGQVGKARVKISPSSV